MKAKWYFSGLVIILALLGICREQITVPNQEIVLQFNAYSVTSGEAQKAIENVKKQLQTIGISNVKVTTETGGKLKIKYYSATNVATVKKILSGDNEFELDYTSTKQDKNHSKFPSEEHLNTYSFDVYEIQNGNNQLSDVSGKYILELKQDYDRFSNPHVFSIVHEIDVKQKDALVKVAYKLNRTVAIAIDNTSHKIPEVRAGPNC